VGMIVEMRMATGKSLKGSIFPIKKGKRRENQKKKKLSAYTLPGCPFLPMLSYRDVKEDL
jgi:hypothetical protein